MSDIAAQHSPGGASTWTLRILGALIVLIGLPLIYLGG